MPRCSTALVRPLHPAPCITTCRPRTCTRLIPKSSPAIVAPPLLSGWRAPGWHAPPPHQRPHASLLQTHAPCGPP